jgi:hypothetical protein
MVGRGVTVLAAVSLVRTRDVDSTGVRLGHQPRPEDALRRLEALGVPPQLGEDRLAHLFGELRAAADMPGD